METRPSTDGTTLSFIMVDGVAHLPYTERYRSIRRNLGNDGAYYFSAVSRDGLMLPTELERPLEIARLGIVNLGPAEIEDLRGRFNNNLLKANDPLYPFFYQERLARLFYRFTEPSLDHNSPPTV